MNYTELAIQLSEDSSKAGGFPAGAVLVTKGGTVYKSGKSVPYLHGEIQVIDKAIKEEGFPIEGSKLFASMEPCLMCTSKIFWSGDIEVIYTIPKAKTNAKYAYEDDKDLKEVRKNLFKQIKFTEDSKFLSAAITVYENWVRKIES